MKYYFEWDPIKARLNQRKHRVSFERACTIFKDPHALSIYDEEHSLREDRWITLGMDINGTILVVVHTYEQISKGKCKIRIISARKATRKEIKQYYEV
ncbi:BrnT family toxin [Thermodesulfatator atlanticus]